ncbi:MULTISPECIES: hypothetical protein [Thermoactinomyces]|jgi:hypothetical protein|uniref:Uncharacterized protein n=1 Tax=Thermoactinomyces daqus TaxID=1329516 RepID=A0A7W2AGD6_9BACL|nr:MULTISPECIES: hypothetical protein [Thermoactinomyces]MBA4542097.1 hypothetical protein [Thermoactinomyces daqus]MBH8598939.1 hypothetical protein [Thermoactinomyces sp. CICC 10523]MBH8604925.1 hypothetical protein [Thermoactinomyces sp. CICC 10522]MBH8608359.1 hypothetical protein [Thermoactinomyces sp. CICC 10521]
MDGAIKGESIGLHRALYGLLYHRSYRQAFLEGRYDKLQLSDGELRQLATIDHEELCATAKNICRNLLSGNLEISGGLKGSYPGVFQELERMGYDRYELMYQFMESPHFEEYRELPFSGVGLCVEEAFYGFMMEQEDFLRESPNNRLLLTHEFLTVMLSILVVNKHPNFCIKTNLIRKNDSCFYAIQSYPDQIASALANRKVHGDSQGRTLYLYAAAKDQFIKGPINPFIARLIELGRAEEITKWANEWMETYQISEEELNDAMEKFLRLGLIG